jgi:hypothetical protein
MIRRQPTRRFSVQKFGVDAIVPRRFRIGLAAWRDKKAGFAAAAAGRTKSISVPASRKPPRRHVANAIKNVRGKLVPEFVVHRFGARKLVQGGAQFLPPRFVCFLAPRKADDAEGRRHLLVFAQVIQRGISLRAVKSPLAPKMIMEHGSSVSLLTAGLTLTSGLTSAEIALFMADTMPQVAGKFNGACATGTQNGPQSDGTPIFPR